jgi:hypothetical protein
LNITLDLLTAETRIADGLVRHGHDRPGADLQFVNPFVDNLFDFPIGCNADLAYFAVFVVFN